jgi:hypothetical protein
VKSAAAGNVRLAGPANAVCAFATEACGVAGCGEAPNRAARAARRRPAPTRADPALSRAVPEWLEQTWRVRAVQWFP